MDIQFQLRKRELKQKAEIIFKWNVEIHCLFHSRLLFGTVPSGRRLLARSPNTTFHSTCLKLVISLQSTWTGDCSNVVKTRGSFG
ncbi:hypothetical protein KIN20_000497 [Parelaphostrongylus tenuis]|uniref:Uncharacterized protein n=1 Tax=Parelaphostrongylus tenuis TaxID=148309 RepID=A0AAD5MDR1_PARTN|nr:hypothetical protein KIN20_000497 [Parelaphostrongylus tenuis]